MAFQRRDIPKMTRAGAAGEPRRLFPRYLKDRRLWPSIERSIAYLDSMVGHRRGDLAGDAILDLIGDPKLAHCLLASLGDSYRFQTPSFHDVLGDSASSLHEHYIMAPADLRAKAYQALQARSQGVLAPAEREAFLEELASPLGLTGNALEELLHLDAERNQRLLRIGPRPRVEDFVARYNALLTLSVLRHASVLDVVLPGLSRHAIETITAHWQVAARRLRGDVWRLGGQQDGRGSWARFGGKLARCAVHLLLLCPGEPSGCADVHLDERRTRLVLDPKVIGTIRLKHHVVAGPDAVIQVAQAMSPSGEVRRVLCAAGWVARRALEPVVLNETLVLPEIVMTRAETSVAVVPVAGDAELEVMETVQAWRPVVGIGKLAGSAKIRVVAGDDPMAFERALEEAVRGHPRASLAHLVQEGLRGTGWVRWGRITAVLGSKEPDVVRLAAIAGTDQAELVPSAGLFRHDWLRAWHDRYASGALTISELRRALADALGDVTSSDALTLHLLSCASETAQRRAA